METKSVPETARKFYRRADVFLGAGPVLRGDPTEVTCSEMPEDSGRGLMRQEVGSKAVAGRN